MRMTSLLALLAALPLLSQAPTGSLDRLPDPKTMPAGKLEAPKPKVQTFTTPNGIRVLFIEDHELPVVTMYTAFKAGALDDPSDKPGVASMTAKLLRTGGTRNYTSSQLDEMLEGLAADAELSASFENTGGGLHCFKQDAPKVLGLLAEMLQAPRFDPERIEFVRTQMISSLKQQEDQPASVAIRGLQRLLFNGKGLGNLPTTASVKAITEADLRTFARTWYVPNNLVLGITGDLNLTEAKELVKKSLGAWPKGQLPARSRTLEPTQAAPGIYLQAKDKLNQSVVLAGMTGPRDMDPDRMALVAAYNVLGEGEFGSRLFNTIRTQQGLAYSAGSISAFSYTVDGLFIAYALTKGESTAKAARLMREECQKLAKDGLTSEEWENARRSLLNKEVFESASARSVIGNAVVLSLFDQPLDTRATRLDKLQGLTLGQVNATIARRFQPEQLRFYVLGDPATFGAEKLETLGKVNPVQK